MKGRHEPRVVETHCCDIDFVKKLLFTCQGVINEANIVDQSKENCSKYAIEFYNSVVSVGKDESFKIVVDTLSQNSNLWLKVRQLRITGTSAYVLYTFTMEKNVLLLKLGLINLKGLYFPPFLEIWQLNLEKIMRTKLRKHLKDLRDFKSKPLVLLLIITVHGLSLALMVFINVMRTLF